MNRYHINLYWSDDDDCWVANVPDLEPCSAFGDSPQEALSEVQVAIELWLETVLAHGWEIPEPRYRPAPRLPVTR